MSRDDVSGMQIDNLQHPAEGDDPTEGGRSSNVGRGSKARRVSFASTAQIRLYQHEANLCVENKENTDMIVSVDGGSSTGDLEEGDVLDDEDMKMTECVERLITSAEDRSFDDTGVYLEDMEITKCVGDVVTEAQPDTFVSESSEMAESMPEAFSERNGVRFSDSFISLSNRFIDSCKREMDNSLPADGTFDEGFPGFGSELGPGTPEAPSIVEDVSFIEDVKRPASFDFINSPTPTKPSLPVKVTKKDDSFPSNESPKPMADVKEFLNKVGIRFLDNLAASSARRDTLTRIRPSDVFLIFKSYSLLMIGNREREMYERGQGHLNEKIKDVKIRVDNITEKFSYNPPPIYYQIQDREDAGNMHLSLKALRSSVRFDASERWNAWKADNLELFASELEEILLRCNSDKKRLVETLSAIDLVKVDLKRQRASCEERYGKLSRKKKGIEAFDWGLYEVLKKSIAEEDEILKTTQKEVDRLKEQQSQVIVEISKCLEDRDRYMQELQGIGEKIDSIGGVSKTELDFVRTYYRFLCKSLNLEVVSVDGDNTSIKFHRWGVILNVSLDGRPPVAAIFRNARIPALFDQIVETVLPAIQPRLFGESVQTGLFGTISMLVEYERLCKEIQDLKLRYNLDVSITNDLSVSIDIPFINGIKEEKTVINITLSYCLQSLRLYPHGFINISVQESTGDGIDNMFIKEIAGEIKGSDMLLTEIISCIETKLQ